MMLYWCVYEKNMKTMRKNWKMRKRKEKKMEMRLLFFLWANENQPQWKDHRDELSSITYLWVYTYLHRLTITLPCYYNMSHQECLSFLSPASIHGSYTRWTEGMFHGSLWWQSRWQNRNKRISPVTAFGGKFSATFSIWQSSGVQRWIHEGKNIPIANISSSDSITSQSFVFTN